MARPTFDRNGRSFRVALLLSCQLHAGVAWAATGWGWLEQLKSPPPQTVETEFIYIGTTGPALQLAQSQPTAVPRRLNSDAPLKARVKETRAFETPSPRPGEHPEALQPYLEQLRSKIGQEIRFPLSGVEGAVLLHFIVDRRGQLQQARAVSDSAGMPQQLKEVASRCLRAAAPFPPLPRVWSKPTAAFTVRVLFRSPES